jgi:mono/diheme cytochrome c family protein
VQNLPLFRLRACASLLLAGAVLGTVACGGDTKPPEEAPLSLMAEKGLTLAPFNLDVTGLSNAEKERIGLGSYYLNALVLCNDCHQKPNPNGPPEYLGGGTQFAIGPTGEKVYSRNLTPHPETGLKLTEAQFIEAIRTGKDFKAAEQGDNEQLIVMPWPVYRWMTEEDLKSIYAYLKKVPPVNNRVDADIKGAAAAAKPVPFPTSYVDGEVARPLPAESASGVLNTERGLAIQPFADPPALGSMNSSDRSLYARGSYLVNAVGDCTGCHTNPLRTADFKLPTDKWLGGGQIFPVPPGLDAVLKGRRTLTANLMGATNGAFSRFMSYEDFRKVIYEGKVTHNGVTRDLAFPMVFTAEGLRKGNEDDIKAIYTYLKAQVRLTGAGDKKIQEPARWCAADTDCKASAGETCDPTTKECVGAACTSDASCDACQTCSTTTSKCVAPTASSTCAMSGY